MFGSIGGPELLLILVIALLVFGPRKIPELSRFLGRGLSEFRRATYDFKSTLEREIAVEESEPAKPIISAPDDPAPGKSSAPASGPPAADPEKPVDPE